MSKIEVSIKTTHKAFPKGKFFGYAAAIMTDAEYRNIFTIMDSAWAFTKPTNLES